MVVGFFAYIAGQTRGTKILNDQSSGRFKINFLKPAFGQKLRCRAAVIRGGSRVIVAESEVTDLREAVQAPEAVAKAMVTLMAVHKEKLTAPPRRVGPA